MVRFIHGLIIVLAAMFLIMLLFFRITEGSFAGAGARMDRFLGAAANETVQVTQDVVERTDEAIKDLNDGD